MAGGVGRESTGVVEHLAELTGLRDRDQLDVTLVGALQDLLRPDALAIYRCVGDGTGAADQRRWLTRARLKRGDVAASADPLWADITSLPLLAAHPERLACLQRNQTVEHVAVAQTAVAQTAAEQTAVEQTAVEQTAAGQITGQQHTTFFPLDADTDTVGVLEVHTALPLTAEAQRLVSSVLRVYRNFQGLLDYSERDTLTGLLNRKTFDDCFARVGALPKAAIVSAAAPRFIATSPAPADAQRRTQAVGTAWLGLIDIDNFKRVNDTHGHLIGDEVLLLLSRLMRSSFRYHDHLFRYGGEEFVVLVRCAGLGDATAAFERFRANVQAYPFPQVGTLTVSLGFTGLLPADSPNDAFDRADRAVYYAKQQGRNQVRHYAQLVAEGQLQDTQRTSSVELF
jgi:diguanylate cyclase (GGDEF)-like protein